MLYKTASRYMVKEAAASGETLGVLGKMKSKISGAWNSTKGTVGRYKKRLLGTNVRKAKEELKKAEEMYENYSKIKSPTYFEKESAKGYKWYVDVWKKRVKISEKKHADAVKKTALTAGGIGAVGGAGVYGYNKLKK